MKIPNLHELLTLHMPANEVKISLARDAIGGILITCLDAKVAQQSFGHHGLSVMKDNNLDLILNDRIGYYCPPRYNAWSLESIVALVKSKIITKSS